MDEQLSAAVKEAFLRMHADGLIYRDVRLVNWDCMLLTAVSDSEVSQRVSQVLQHASSRIVGQICMCFGGH